MAVSAVGPFNPGGSVERMVGLGIELELHNAVRLRIRQSHARCCRGPIVPAPEQSEQRDDDRRAGIWPTAAIKNNTRHKLAVPRREPLAPRTQFLVISGEINCSAAAV